jgi:hypothetical protein
MLRVGREIGINSEWGDLDLGFFENDRTNSFWSLNATHRKMVAVFSPKRCNYF